MPDPDVVIVRIAVAAVLAGLISILARRRGLLDPGGAIAAMVLGTAIVGIGGWWAGILLVAFFVSSSLLSSSSSKSPSRSWHQVVANGGPAVLMAVLALSFDHPVMMVATAACLAGATADTWATEVGRRSGAIPRSITTFRKVPVGTSGAISVPGTGASVAGALMIAIMAIALRSLAPINLPEATLALIAMTVGGSSGSLIDTLLGATLQARYRCEACGALLESSADHDIGHNIHLESGVALVTNDTVNFAASFLAGIIAMVVVYAGA